LQIRTADGKTTAQKLSREFKSNPTALAFHDINQDGLNDLMCWCLMRKIKILLQSPDNPFEEQDVAPPGGTRTARG